jgi:hypothetical protein
MDRWDSNGFLEFERKQKEEIKENDVNTYWFVLTVCT